LSFSFVQSSFAAISRTVYSILAMEMITLMDTERLLRCSCAAATLFLVLKVVALRWINDKLVVFFVSGVTITHHLSLLRHGCTALRNNRSDIVMTRVLAVWYGFIVCLPLLFSPFVLVALFMDPLVWDNTFVWMKLLFVSSPALVEHVILRELSRRMRRTSMDDTQDVERRHTGDTRSEHDMEKV
jgi:hypothetical protein